MNLLVLLFFLQNIIITAILGYKFVAHKSSVFKNFGIALFLNAAAFAIWTFAILQKGQNLEMHVTVGAALFITSLVYLLLTGTQGMETSTRKTTVAIGVIAALALFYIRTFMFPATPTFSPEGLFFFNIQPLVQMLYIFGLGLCALPAVDQVASHFKGQYASIVKYSFIVEVMGGIILMTNTNPLALYILGWIMGVVYLVLCATILFRKKAWS